MPDRSWKVHLCSIILAVMAAMWLADLYLVVTTPPTMAEAARAAGKPFDTRDRAQVLADLRRSGADACRSITPIFFLETDGLTSGGKKLYPLGGISRKLTLGNNETGAFGIYTSDEHGFNNPVGLHGGSLDAALVGDSFTHGHLIEAGSDIASWLRKRGVTALNLGMSGAGPLEELAIMTEYALPARPRVLLWLYYEGNDLADLSRSSTCPTMMRYLEDEYSQGLAHRQAEIDDALTRFVEDGERKARALPDRDESRAVRKSPIVRVLKLEDLRGRLDVMRKVKATEQTLSLFRDVLAAAKRRVERTHGKMVFVYLPEWYRYGYGWQKHESFRDRRKVLATVAALGIPMIDIHETFSGQPDPLSFFPFRLYGHYTPEGFRLVADTIARRLKEANLEATAPGRSAP